MQEKKKKLLKQFKAAVEDLLDNYDKYTDGEKAQVKEIFQKVADLNKVLDKYDIEFHFDWDDYVLNVGQYFDTVHLM